jgi:putative spermidine/putrescine transport system permease protein
VMRAIDLRLVEAAQSLGADPYRAFWRVFLPLSMPGVRGATTLIFILGLGFFVTPALMGGRKEITIAMLIDTQFSELLNWGFGSALAVVLLTVTLLGLAVYYWLLGRAGAKVTAT